MKLKTLLPSALCLTLFFGGYGVKADYAQPRSISSNDCEGNACSVIELTWDNERQQFRVKNNSNRSVKVEVSTFAGISSVLVPPKEVNYLEVKTFNGPYRANYE